MLEESAPSTEAESGNAAKTTGEPARAPRWRGVLVATLSAFALFMLPPFIEALESGERVALGVRVGDVLAARLERRELQRALERRGRELEQRRSHVLVAGKRFELEPRALGFEIDVRATLERALAVGRGTGIFGRGVSYWRRLFSAEDAGLVTRVERAKLRALAGGWEERALVDRPFPGGIRVEGVSVAALPPRPGRTLALGAAETALLRGLVARDRRDIELPVVHAPSSLPPAEAERVALQARVFLAGPVVLISSEPGARVVLAPHELGPALRAEPRGRTLVLGFARERLEAALADARRAIEREPVEARFEIDAREQISIVPSRPGVRFDGSKLEAALLNASERADRTGELPLLHEPKPALDSGQAEGLGIRGLVSSFTTRHPCCERRVDNIHRIAELLNGVVVRPGETASVNALVGPRTAKNGFVPAPTIEEGEVVDSVGGGVSQFATTLFNALFHGGYEIVERQPHTYWFPRYPMGHEATLSFPKPDVIFRNDTGAGLLIKTAYTGTSITVKLYGDNGGRKVRATVSRRQNVVEPGVELLANARVPPDEERVKEGGSVGWSVIVSRLLTFADGTTKEERRRVTYKPRAKRVEVHPCRIPKGDKGYTGERCPEPEDVEEIEEE